MKLPAIQFYPADWRKDPGVQSLTFEHRGIWFEIICLMHESEQRGKLLLKGMPMPEDALARLLGLDKQILTTCITTLIQYGVASKCPDTGALMNRRMVRDEELRQKRSNCGKLGGNPALLKQNTTYRDTEDNHKLKQTPTPSSSSSTTVSEDALSSSPTPSPVRSRFAAPTLDEVKLQCAKIGLPDSEAESFMAYYASNGWKVGRNPMRDWRSATINWRKHWQERHGTNRTPSSRMTQADREAEEARILREAIG